MPDLIKAIQETLKELGYNNLDMLFMVVMLLMFIYLFNMFQKYSEISRKEEVDKNEARLATLLTAERNLEKNDADFEIILGDLYNLIEKSSPYMSYEIYKILESKNNEPFSIDEKHKIKLLLNEEIKRIILINDFKYKPGSIKYNMFNFLQIIGNVFIVSFKAYSALMIFSLFILLSLAGFSSKTLFVVVPFFLIGVAIVTILVGFLQMIPKILKEFPKKK